MASNTLLIHTLQESGLGEKEAKIYLTLLELEVAGVQDIAKIAGINRSSAYVVLESLKARGLVSISDDKKVRRYTATTPEAVLRAAEDKAINEGRIAAKIKKILPDLKSLYKETKKKPLVRVFEGKEGLISGFEDTLINKEKLMRVYSSPGNLGDIVVNYIPTYIRARFKAGIKMRGIHPNNKINRSFGDVSPKNFDSYALIPENKYGFPADLAIYDDKIAYMSGESGGIAVIIQSKEMAQVMKNVFDLAFEQALHSNKSKPKKKK